MNARTITEPYLQFTGITRYVRRGDQVTLHADRVDNNSANFKSGSLALQLWACPNMFKGGMIQGHKLAEFPLGVLDPQCFFAPLEGTVSAALPAGGDYAMVMTVAEWDGESYNRIHDYHTYPMRDVFDAPVAAVAEKSARDIPAAAPAITAPSSKSKKKGGNAPGTGTTLSLNKKSGGPNQPRMN